MQTDFVPIGQAMRALKAGEQREGAFIAGVTYDGLYDLHTATPKRVWVKLHPYWIQKLFAMLPPAVGGPITYVVRFKGELIHDDEGFRLSAINYCDYLPGYGVDRFLGEREDSITTATGIPLEALSEYSFLEGALLAVGAGYDDKPAFLVRIEDEKPVTYRLKGLYAVAAVNLICDDDIFRRPQIAPFSVFCIGKVRHLPNGERELNSIVYFEMLHGLVFHCWGKALKISGLFERIESVV